LIADFAAADADMPPPLHAADARFRVMLISLMFISFSASPF